MQGSRPDGRNIKFQGIHFSTARKTYRSDEQSFQAQIYDYASDTAALHFLYKRKAKWDRVDSINENTLFVFQEWDTTPQIYHVISDLRYHIKVTLGDSSQQTFVPSWLKDLNWAALKPQKE